MKLSQIKYNIKQNMKPINGILFLNDFYEKSIRRHPTQFVYQGYLVSDSQLVLSLEVRYCFILTLKCYVALANFEFVILLIQILEFVKKVLCTSFIPNE